MEDDTTDNFFRWLDRGGGKDLSLDECSRERLEKERIIYLSSEQRRNYLVKFDSEGRLRWIKDDKLVDTTSAFWKDDGQGGGVVLDSEIESPRPEPTRRLSFVEGAAASVQSETASKMDQPITRNRFTKPLKKNLTFQGWIAKALEQHSKKSEWIYAADKQCWSGFSSMLGSDISLLRELVCRH
ncbi:hypothetical protein DL96DRAFT_1575466 [Flagelloscypha sp. PMI_526]|nr:hypothetical protein DL96DRAFT_1575466 [Flagelloscypha sp. PMI_526]